MKKIDKNIIRVEEEMDLERIYEDPGVIYLNEFYYTDLINHIIDLNSSRISGDILTEKDVFYNLIRGEEEDYFKILKENDYGCYIYDLEELEEFKTLEDYITEFSEIDLLHFFLEPYEDNIIEKLCTKNNCKFGTVGYSPWSYYIAYKDIEDTFIRDLYEGWNWYTISLWSEDGDMLDSIGGIYAPNIEDLDTAISDYFGLEPDNYYLIDNACAKYFDKPKVKELVTEHYHFEVID